MKDIKDIKDCISSAETTSGNAAQTTKNVSSILRSIKSILIIGSLIIVCVGGYFALKSFGFDFGFEKNKIDNTPNQITQIKEIGEWEFLNLEYEVLVDTVRERSFLLTDDCLARIYHGAMRLGINVHDFDDNWIETYGDSVAVLNLPSIKLLDDRFIDEALTETFYENGKWDGATKEVMFREAEAKMRALALTAERYEMARAQAEARFTALFKALGFKTVTINIDK